MPETSGDEPTLAGVADTRTIEWPPRSGVTAEYAPDEEAFLRTLIEGCEAGYLDEAQLAAEVGILHGLKAELDARIVGDGESPDDVDDFEPTPPDSPFRIPPRAADLLLAHDPQLRLE